MRALCLFAVLMVACASASAQQRADGGRDARRPAAEAGREAKRPAGTHKPGQTFKECRNCPEMVVLPPGTFMMGSPANEPERRENERHHSVAIARAFAMGKTEVTWDQWEACVRDTWCDGVAVEHALKTNEDGTPNKAFVDWGRGTRPAVGMSWFDAQTFVGWLNWKTGEDDAYRLPSDAEWEYAARAGSTTAYPWGAKLDHNFGNFGKESPGLGGKAEGRDVWVDQSAPVASFPANAFGLHDMNGNLFEWVEDCYEADRKNAPADGSANKQGNCANRVFRDGTFMSNPYMHRSARRGAPYPATRRGRNYLGFRVAKTLD
jgi:formylglycine-generating enzyme required for sulfatase activity